MAKKPRHETGAVDVSTEALREQIAGCLLTARERTQLLTGCVDEGDLVRRSRENRPASLLLNAAAADQMC